MIWFFSRDDKDLRIETRYDNEAADYVLVVHWPDGRSQSERFSVESQFRSRVVEFQKYIEDEGWASSGSPEIFTVRLPLARQESSSRPVDAAREVVVSSPSRAVH